MTPITIHALYLDNDTLKQLSQGQKDNLNVVVMKSVKTTIESCGIANLLEHAGQDEIDRIGFDPSVDVIGSAELLLPRFLGQPDDELIRSDDDYNNIYNEFDASLKDFIGSNDDVLDAIKNNQGDSNALPTPVLIFISQAGPRLLEVPLHNKPGFDPLDGRHLIEVFDVIGRDIAAYFGFSV